MKKLLVVVIALGVLAAAAVLALPHFISPERIKQELVARVQEATGRTLKIEGALDFTVFPALGVQAQKVSLSGPEGFGDKPFVALEELQVSVALMPLLSKDIQITRFVLTDPVIVLHKNKGGKGNWEFTPAKPAAAPAEATQNKPQQASEGGLPKNLRLSDIEVKNGALLYTDETTGTTQKLEKLNAKLNVSSLTSPLDLTGSAVWQGKEVSAKLHVSSAQALMLGQAADFDAELGSELLEAGAKGKLDGDKLDSRANIKSPSLKQLMVAAAGQQAGGCFHAAGV